MRTIKSGALLLAALLTTGCSGIKTYHDSDVTTPFATLTVSAESDTFFDREIYVHLYDFETIRSGEGCGQTGLIFKETVIKSNAYLGTIAADTDDASPPMKIPAKPLRVVAEFQDPRGNTTVINYTDIIFLAEPSMDYELSYKRMVSSSGHVIGDFSFKERSPEGLRDLERIYAFDIGICDQHLKAASN